MYLSTNEIAHKWGVSVTWVTILCKQGRIPGVVRKGNRWLIPADTTKPADKRKNKTAVSTARFKFVDLFAGVGGFHQAMRYLGGECVMAAEINQECVKTYKLNFKTSEKEIRGDVKKIDPTSIAPFDVLCAGFPCQPFSKAGAQQGFQDKTRGNLFYTIMDILDAHPEVKFIILENVRNLADKSENWDIITSELMKRNFYITKEPVILSPSDFGIPQIRERVYILGIRKDIRNETSEFSAEEIDAICECIRGKEFIKDSVFLLVSLRTDRYSLQRDIGKTMKLYAAMEDAGFECEDNKTTVKQLANAERKIREVDPSFRHPGKVIDQLKELSESCIEFKINGKNCKRDCGVRLNRWPILKCQDLQFQCFKFTRR